MLPADFALPVADGVVAADRPGTLRSALAFAAPGVRLVVRAGFAHCTSGWLVRARRRSPVPDARR